MKKISLLLILSLLAFSVSAEKIPGTGSTIIKGDLYFSVSQQHLKADLDYQYVPDENGVSQISFFLTKDVTIDQLEGDAIEAYTFDKEAKPFATLIISFKEPLEKGTTANFSLAYSGTLTKGFWTDQYGWIDIDPDFMILPLFTDFSGFNYEIHAELDDPEYQFIDVRNAEMSSALDISGASVFYFESIVAGSEMNFNRLAAGDYTINIISNKPDSVVSFLRDKSVEILDYFNSTIGQKSRVKDFTVLYRPLPDTVFRTIRSLTAERFIMFSSDHERIPTLAHEVSHFWWNRGNDLTMEKWLDESFAEYSKLMYIREFHGQDSFREAISQIEQKAGDLPSILNSDRFGPNGSGLLYEKGPYLLYQLEEMLGKEKFRQLLSRLNEAEVATTEDMLEELEKIAGAEVRNIFREKLMN